MRYFKIMSGKYAGHIGRPIGKNSNGLISLVVETNCQWLMTSVRCIELMPIRWTLEHHKVVEL